MAFTSPYRNTVVMGPLAAAVANGIAQSQSGTAATPLTLNGSLVTAGVANLVTPRRVIVTSAGNDSGITFVIVGTDRYGRPQSETLTGANTAAAQTVRDFLTVNSITPSGNTAAAVTSGTSSVASSVPCIIDTMAAPQNIGASVVVSGTVNYTVESTNDDLGPDYNLVANPPNWFPESSFTAQTASVRAALNILPTMVRLTINSGTGTATMSLTQMLGAGIGF